MMQSSEQQIIWNGTDFTWTDRMYIGQTNQPNTIGIAASTQYYRAVLNFIPCEVLAGKNVTIGGLGENMIYVIGCVFYTDDNEASCIKNACITSNNDELYTVPNNAKYCRFAQTRGIAIDEFYIKTV